MIVKNIKINDTIKNNVKKINKALKSEIIFTDYESNLYVDAIIKNDLYLYGVLNDKVIFEKRIAPIPTPEEYLNEISIGFVTDKFKSDVIHSHGFINNFSIEDRKITIKLLNKNIQSIYINSQAKENYYDLEIVSSNNVYADKIFSDYAQKIHNHLNSKIDKISARVSHIIYLSDIEIYDLSIYSGDIIHIKNITADYLSILHNKIKVAENINIKKHLTLNDNKLTSIDGLNCKSIEIKDNLIEKITSNEYITNISMISLQGNHISDFGDFKITENRLKQCEQLLKDCDDVDILSIIEYKSKPSNPLSKIIYSIKNKIELSDSDISEIYKKDSSLAKLRKYVLKEIEKRGLL